ncbi:MAG: glycosyltransferase family 4 protein [Candidatus Poribacteria bacterium]|nr:glycosyltransferase family 4 protein [Candidatus Poribacteria bacterium]
MKILDPSKYNILYLDSGSGIGGGQRSLLLLLKMLDKERWTPYVGCLGNSPFASEVGKTDAHVVPLTLPEAHNKTDKVQRFTIQDLLNDFRQLRVIGQLHKAVRQHRIALIHANSLSVALLGGVVAKWNRIPILMHKRYATSYGILDKICEKLLQRVILVSEATRWDFASETKQTLIYNGVDLDAFQATQAEVETLRTELFSGQNGSGHGGENSKTRLVVGVVTRITPEKGIHFLVKAMAKLKESVLSNSADVKLLIVGGPYFQKDYEYMASLKQETTDLGVADSVIFTGFLSDTRVVTSLLDIVLVPSIIPEACPRTIIEAMAVGKPVIATPLGGSKELVTSETGILVSPENAEEIASAITELATNQDRLVRMGKAARQRAEQLFSCQKNTILTETVYTELLTAR